MSNLSIHSLSLLCFLFPLLPGGIWNWGSPSMFKNSCSRWILFFSFFLPTSFSLSPSSFCRHPIRSISPLDTSAIPSLPPSISLFALSFIEHRTTCVEMNSPIDYALFSFHSNRIRTTTQVIWTDQPYWKSIIRSHSTLLPSRDNSAMLKTTSLTKTLFNHQTHSQPINLYTPSNTSSSGSVCETDPSSTSSSYKNQLITNGTSHHDETNVSQQEGSTLVLISMIEKLKRELSTVKQAKCQLESLYKVSRSRGCFFLAFRLFAVFVVRLST